MPTHKQKPEAKMEWRENLKPGDKAIIESRYGKRIVEVVRVTKTMVIVGLKSDGRVIEERFRINSGRSVGSDVWTTSHLTEWSQDREDKIKEDAMRDRIINKIKGKTYWTRLPTADLVKIHDIISSHSAFSTE